MSETVWVALVAVLGTAIGAAIAPVSKAFRSRSTARRDLESNRLRATADLATALIRMANTPPKEYAAGGNARTVERTATEARFELARYLPRGAGQVDRFVEISINVVTSYESKGPRLLAAEYAASKLMDWARGDVRPAELEVFDVDKDAGELIIVGPERLG